MMIIGSDECLKGDTFGGIVVAGVKAGDKEREELQKIGVKDSKKLTDKRIIELAERIKKITFHSVKEMMPEEFNEYKMTDALNKLHRDVAKELGEGKHIVDKYPGCNVGDLIETKAEDKYIEVAAASILARAKGLEQFKVLSKKAGFELPLGSTHVRDALIKLKEKKLDPNHFVKLSFKNVIHELDLE